MILNSTTDTHDLYLPRRRARKLPARKVDPLDKQLDGNPHGSLEERCAWMRSRQEARKKSKGAPA